MMIQKAIQERHLKFDNKMKLDGHPFPQNMIRFSINMMTAEEKGKVKEPRTTSNLGAGSWRSPSRYQEPCRDWGVVRGQAQGHYAHPPQQVAAPARERALPEKKAQGREMQGRGRSAQERFGEIRA
jgi:hypothetical protein